MKCAVTGAEGRPSWCRLLAENKRPELGREGPVISRILFTPPIPSALPSKMNGVPGDAQPSLLAPSSPRPDVPMSYFSPSPQQAGHHLYPCFGGRAVTP